MGEQEIRTVWMVSREYDSLAGAGGVKDVCRQLAETLVRHGGCRVRVILPRYGFMDAEALGFVPLELPSRKRAAACRDRRRRSFAVEMNYTDRERREEVSIWERSRDGLTIFLVEAERFAEKLGVYTYTAAEEEKTPWQRQGSGHYDYFAMNILLQKAALDLMILLDEPPDAIHCQDGHAATLAAMARENSGHAHFFRETGLVVTIHNAGLGYHQEVEDLAFARAVTGLPQSVIMRGRLGRAFDPFVAAADYALINTVSEQYARELQETREDVRTGWLGHRLLQRGVRIIGITNGINPRDVDPTRPEQLGLAAPFDPLRGDLAGKRVCKQDMLDLLAQPGQVDGVEQFGTLAPDADLPLFTFIGRLTAQKGVDVLLPALAGLAAEDSGFQVLALGSGDPGLEQSLAVMTARDCSRPGSPEPSARTWKPLSSAASPARAGRRTSTPFWAVSRPMKVKSGRSASGARVPNCSTPSTWPGCASRSSMSCLQTRLPARSPRRGSKGAARPSCSGLVGSTSRGLMPLVMPMIRTPRCSSRWPSQPVRTSSRVSCSSRAYCSLTVLMSA